MAPADHGCAQCSAGESFGTAPRRCHAQDPSCRWRRVAHSDAGEQLWARLCGAARAKSSTPWRALRFERRLVALDFGPERLRSLEFEHDRVDLGPRDALILAAPWSVTAALVPGVPAPSGASAAMTVHFAAVSAAVVRRRFSPRSTARSTGSSPITTASRSRSRTLRRGSTPRAKPSRRNAGWASPRSPASPTPCQPGEWCLRGGRGALRRQRKLPAARPAGPTGQISSWPEVTSAARFRIPSKPPCAPARRRRGLGSARAAERRRACHDCVICNRPNV